MNEAIIKVILNRGDLRIRQIDKAKIKSLIESAENNAEVILQILLDKKSATTIFREYYESIRQLSEAAWWVQGYEPKDHETSLMSLKYLEIKNKTKLQQLDRFRKIRNNVNYKGYKVPKEQAQEIIVFWKECSKEIIQKIREKI